MRWTWALALAGIGLAFGAAPARPQASIPLVEGQDVFLEQCREETVAAYPNARDQADSICNSKWEQITLTGPLADAVMAMAPANGGAFDAAGARELVGTLDEFHAEFDAADEPSVTFSWSRDGEPIPFDVEGALRVRGLTLAMIGCQWFGFSENTRVYRVDGQGKAPFAVTVYNRNAAVASQSSFYSVTANYSAQIPTLESLNSDGSEYAADCPG